MNVECSARCEVRGARLIASALLDGMAKQTAFSFASVRGVRR